MLAALRGWISIVAGQVGVLLHHNDIQQKVTAILLLQLDQDSK